MLAVKIEPMFAEVAEKRKLAQLKHSAISLVTTDLGERGRSIQAKRERQLDTKAGKAFGVSGTTVKKAKKIAKTNPQKIESIIAGKTTVDTEYRKLVVDLLQEFRLYLCRWKTPILGMVKIFLGKFQACLCRWKTWAFRPLFFPFDGNEKTN
jgi:hypothetical protein